MAKLSLSNIVKKYSNSNNTKEDIVVVHNFSLDVADGEFIVLVGPSGCGKSTTLRMIAGLEEISSGQLLIDGNIVNDLPPKDRDVAMVFQSYALYPHMSVYDNMAFGLQLRKYPKAEIQERVNVAAKILGLEPYLDRKPKALSGGQRQRVAMGRAIVRKPKIFLFDEPLSNLDAKLRVQMRSEIAKLHRQLKTTSIYVTHDQTEAMTLADRIVIMKDGHIQQIGTPLELYREPANVFVASFIGSPSMNFLKGRFVDNHMKSDSFSIPINNHLVNQLQNGQEILLGIRPESIRISNSKTEQPTNDALKQNNEVSFLGVVETKEVLGSEMFIYFSVDKETIVGRFPPDYHFNNGDNIKLSIDPSGCHIFDAKTEQRLSTH